MNNPVPKPSQPDIDDSVSDVSEIDASSSAGSDFPETSKAAPVDLLMSIPVTLSMELGRAKIPMKDIMSLKAGSVVELNRLTSEPIDILINGKLVALGEAVTAGEKYGIRVVQVLGDDNHDKKVL